MFRLPTQVMLLTSVPRVSDELFAILVLPLQLCPVGGFTTRSSLLNGSDCATLNGWSLVPVPQLLLAGIPPTAATGLATTVADPVATAAFIDLELVIIPQPRLR